MTQLVESIGDLATLLMARTHYLGQTNFTDSLTQTTVTLDYASTNTNQYPAALAGAARWNQAATATPLQDLQSHTFYYRVTAAVGQPDGILMNENTYEKMISTDEVKTSVLASQGIDLTSVSLYRVEDAALNSSLLSRKIPPITLVNKKYQDENQANVLTEDYFIPDGYYAFFWLGNAERALGPTVEADFSGGIYSASEELSQSPPIDRLYAVANGIPFIADARKLGGRQVY